MRAIALRVAPHRPCALDASVSDSLIAVGPARARSRGQRRALLAGTMLGGAVLFAALAVPAFADGGAGGGGGGSLAVGGTGGTTNTTTAAGPAASEPSPEGMAAVAAAVGRAAPAGTVERAPIPAAALLPAALADRALAPAVRTEVTA